MTGPTLELTREQHEELLLFAGGIPRSIGRRPNSNLIRRGMLERVGWGSLMYRITELGEGALRAYASVEGAVPHFNPDVWEMREGWWYAFDFEGRKFFAVVHNEGTTGFLELTEIPDPYKCRHCGRGYQDGNHFNPGMGFHEYEQSVPHGPYPEGD